MLKWHISRTAVIAVSAGVGVIVGSMFLPALADVINATQSPTPTDTSDSNYDASATPAPGSANADTPTAEPTPTDAVLPTTPPLASNQVLDGLVAVHQAQVWLQMAQVWNKLCLDEGDYTHAQEQVDYYTSTGELDIANRYQVLLSTHLALVDSTNETIGLLQKRLGAISRNSVSTLNLQDQVDQAQLDRAAAQGESDLLVVAAKNGYINANNQGLDTTLWQSQLNALLSARQLFADSRQAF